MNTRSVLWLAAVGAVAAVLVLPGDAGAELKIRKQHAIAEDTEPEVPNIAAPRDRDRALVEPSPVDDRRIVRAPAARPEDWFERVLRIIRSLNLGGLAR